MSIANVGKVVGNFEQNIMKVVKEGTDLFFNPNATEAERLKWEQDVKNVFGGGEQSFGDEARSQAQEGATQHLMSRGLSKADAEKWAENTLKKVTDISEKVRKGLPKVEAAARLGWLKSVGAITAIFVAGLIVSRVINEPRLQKQQEMIEYLQGVEMRNQQLQQFLVSEQQFNMMIKVLDVPTAPAPVENAHPIAAVALPRPVAAVAALPVQVILTTSKGTRTFESNIGQVYRYVPEYVREDIERTVSAPPPSIDHAYDHEDPNDCFHTHCLGGGMYHKTFTIDGTPFGSATFSY